MNQWLYEASDEYTLTFWNIMRKYAAKIEDKKQEDVEWTYLSDYS